MPQEVIESANNHIHYSSIFSYKTCPTNVTKIFDFYIATKRQKRKKTLIHITNSHNQTLESSVISHSSWRQPSIPGNEVGHGEPPCLVDADDAISGPCDPLARPRASAHVGVLGEVEGAEDRAAVARPLDPPSGDDGIVDVRLHDDGPRIRLPWPAEVGLDGVFDGG